MFYSVSTDLNVNSETHLLIRKSELLITGLFVWGDFDFSLSLLTSYRFVQIFCFFFIYFCSFCVHRNVCFIQVIFCAGLRLFIITVVVGLVLGFCYLTKIGSPPPLGVKPTY